MNSLRDLLKLASLAGLAPSLPTFAANSDPPDYKIEIAPLTLDLSPRQRLRTVAYNGQVPGPLLRFREGESVTVEVVNRSDRPEVLHWQGLFLPPDVDGAAEVGTKLIAPNTSARYRFTPRPSGFRWYHTHTMAMGDLTRAQYGGQHGFLMVESHDEPGRYDQEFFLALHDCDGHLPASEDGAMSPSYGISTINGKSYPETGAAPLQAGRRHRLQFINKIKDVVLVDPQTRTEVDFIADYPGATLFHCHQQNHMDLGFMLRVDYA